VSFPDNYLKWSKHAGCDLWLSEAENKVTGAFLILVYMCSIYSITDAVFHHLKAYTPITTP